LIQIYTMEKSLDKYTGEEFVKKRINQVFARPKNRIAFHNKKANDLRRSLLYINQPLNANVRILNNLMKDKKEQTFHKQYLYGKGFDFRVLTHYVTYNDKSENAIYGYIVIRINDEKIKIIKND
jgi:hypothetical protein